MAVAVDKKTDRLAVALDRDDESVYLRIYEGDECEVAGEWLVVRWVAECAPLS